MCERAANARFFCIFHFSICVCVFTLLNRFLLAIIRYVCLTFSNVSIHMDWYWGNGIHSDAQHRFISRHCNISSTTFVEATVRGSLSLLFHQVFHIRWSFSLLSGHSLNGFCLALHCAYLKILLLLKRWIKLCLPKHTHTRAGSRARTIKQYTYCLTSKWCYFQQIYWRNFIYLSNDGHNNLSTNRDTHLIAQSFHFSSNFVVEILAHFQFIMNS